MRTSWRSFTSSMLEITLPSPCVSCGRSIPEWRPPLGLCVHCRGRVRATERTCPQCGLPSPSFTTSGSDALVAERCGACLVAPPPFDRVLSCFLYLEPVDSVVHQLKYGGLRYLGRHAAEALIERHAASLRTVDVVVPMPLHWSRRLRRGYNQAADISRPLARGLRRRHVPALRRTRRGPRQVGRSRDARRTLPSAAFDVRRPRAVDGRHVLLVDDVVTTGATAAAATAALWRGGATEVTVAALARTPDSWSDATGPRPSRRWQAS